MPIVVFNEGCVFRSKIEESLARSGLASRIAYEGQSYGNVRGAVAAGFGITALTEDQLMPLNAQVVTRFGESPLPDLGSVEVLVAVAAGRDGPPVRMVRRELGRSAAERLRLTAQARTRLAG